MNWSYRWLLLSTISGLQTEPGFSTRAATVLNHWASLHDLCFLYKTLWLKTTTKQQLELSQACIKSINHFRKSCVHVGTHMCAFLWMWDFSRYRGQRVTCGLVLTFSFGTGFSVVYHWACQAHWSVSFQDSFSSASHLTPGVDHV